MDSQLLFGQTWQGFTRWCYTPNIMALGLVVPDKIVLVFPIYAYVIHVSICMGPFLTPAAYFEQTR